MAIPRILVVEDSTMLRRLACEMLSMAGYAVDEAADGTEALEVMRASRPDVVLSDMNMGPMDGFELLRHMRIDSGLAAIRFVLMSGEQTPEAVAHALSAGIDGYLTKPFGRDQLIHQVAAVLRHPRQAA